MKTMWALTLSTQRAKRWGSIAKLYGVEYV